MEILRAYGLSDLGDMMLDSLYDQLCIIDYSHLTWLLVYGWICTLHCCIYKLYSVVGGLYLQGCIYDLDMGCLCP